MEKTTVSLGTALDIAHVAGLKDRLAAALEKDKPLICINVEKLERVDTAGLQLVYAFSKTVETQGKTISWIKPSDKFLTACENSGMNEYLTLN